LSGADFEADAAVVTREVYEDIEKNFACYNGSEREKLNPERMEAKKDGAKG
jgi:hypothetical protein